MRYKLIGLFSEQDGIEVDDFKILKDRLGLIGCTSEDVGEVKLYYDDKGTTYAIVHDSVPYYGDNRDGYKFFDKQTNTFSQYTNLKDMYKHLLTSYCECGQGHDILDEKDRKMKCRHCKMLNNIDTTDDLTMTSYIKEYEYEVFKDM